MNLHQEVDDDFRGVRIEKLSQIFFEAGPMRMLRGMGGCSVRSTRVALRIAKPFTAARSIFFCCSRTANFCLLYGCRAAERRGGRGACAGGGWRLLRAYPSTELSTYPFFGSGPLVVPLLRLTLNSAKVSKRSCPTTRHLA